MVVVFVLLLYNVLVPLDFRITPLSCFVVVSFPPQSNFSGLAITLQARRKSEELKSELSDSSKRNSVAADSGSKRSSLFSPESDGMESPRKLSLKSSAQAVRFMNKGKQPVRLG